MKILYILKFFIFVTLVSCPVFSEEGPIDAETLFLQGEKYFKAENMDRAGDIFFKVLEIDPKHVSSLTMMGIIYGRAGDAEQSLHFFQRVLDIEPENAQVLRYTGLAYHILGEIEKSIESYKQAVRISPENAAFQRDLGIAYGKANQWDKSIVTLRQAVNIDPDVVQHWRDLGWAFRNAGKLAQAIEAYQTFVHLEPDVVAIWLELGALLYRTEQWDEAEAAYRKALEIEPENQGAWDGLAKTYIADGKHKEALFASLRELDVSSEGEKPLFLKLALAESRLAAQSIENVLFRDTGLGQTAVLYAQSGKFSEAYETTMMMKDDGLRLRTLSEIALNLHFDGQSDDAMRQLHQSMEEALTITDQRGRSNALGVISSHFAEVGQFDAAMATLEKLSRDLPSNKVWAMGQIALSLSRFGDNEEGKALLAEMHRLAKEIPEDLDGEKSRALVHSSAAFAEFKLFDKALDAALAANNQRQRDLALAALSLGQAKAGHVHQVLVTIDRIETPSIAVDALVELGGTLAKDGNPDWVAQVLDRAVSISATIANTINRNESIWTIAVQYSKAGHVDAARDLALKIDHPFSRAATMAGVAVGFAKKGDVETSDRLFTEAGKLVAEADGGILDLNREKALEIIAIHFAEAGQYWHAYQTAERIESLHGRSMALEAIATLHAEAGEYARALVTAMTINEAFRKTLTLNTIADLLIADMLPIVACDHILDQAPTVGSNPRQEQKDLEGDDRLIVHVLRAWGVLPERFLAPVFALRDSSRDIWEANLEQVKAMSKEATLFPEKWGEERVALLQELANYMEHRAYLQPDIAQENGKTLPGKSSKYTEPLGVQQYTASVDLAPENQLEHFEEEHSAEYAQYKQQALDREQAEHMAMRTMNIFLNALREKDLTSFWEDLSTQGQLESTVFQMNLDFAFLMKHVEQGVDWENNIPELDWPPISLRDMFDDLGNGEDDQIIISGHYPLADQVLFFSIFYLLEDGEWRNAALSVDLFKNFPVWMTKHLDNPDEAIATLRESLSLAFEQLPRDIPMVIANMMQLGMTYAMLEKYDHVLPIYMRALVMSEAYFGLAHSKINELLYALMSLYMLEGNWEEGRKYDAWAKVVDQARQGDEDAMQRLFSDPDILHLRSRAAEFDLQRELTDTVISDEK
ncbi:tetratricopeptide repeat protein [Desulfobulbus alkaliphilus]|uniref:tetratricopeptide repeat protein n=1 Tax=Desulfobulbus alkaliphilus TaxID=869814 RepID=UPI001965D80D|nr:tetratricopeptide repeat protein [Desulfobulbus alkaliphilus]MBM9538542.1 tetratricopeptide repeat protein [Desulfobulbus alkaliphilus]